MTSTETKTQTTTASPNLRQTRKEQAAKKAPAKTAPAAKAAPAKKATPTPTEKVATPADRKLRWTLAEPKVDNKPVEQSAETEGHAYAIERSGDAWRATHTFDGKTEVLSDTTFAKAYTTAVTHNKTRA